MSARPNHKPQLKKKDIRKIIEFISDVRSRIDNFEKAFSDARYETMDELREDIFIALVDALTSTLSMTLRTMITKLEIMEGINDKKGFNETIGRLNSANPAGPLNSAQAPGR